MFQSNFRILPVVIAIGVLAMCLTSGAEIPRYINYQGKVTDSGGTPVADGNYTMQFRIYDTATGGSLLWDSNNQSVSLSDGIANVILGESSQPTLSLDFDADYWLLVTFEGTDQSPRVRLTSAGYSYMASGLVPGTVITGSMESPLLTVNNTGDLDYAYGGSFKSAATWGVGVEAIASATTGVTVGVRGVVSSTGGSGVIGHSQATTGQSCGVIGTTSSIGGRGVCGYANSTTGVTDGVYGLSAATSGRGVFGEATSSTGVTTGVLGVVHSSEGSGVLGVANATTGNNHGVYGHNLSVDGSGVYGLAVASTGTNYGVFGATNSPSGYAGYFSGNTRVTGNLTVDGTLSGSGIGDITAVNAGTGLDGGGATGSVTLDVEVPLALVGTSSNPIIRGTNNGSGYGVEGSAMSTYGRGVHGVALATTGQNYGGYFASGSAGGTGVYGVVEPPSNADRFGVFGECFPSENWGIGVKGEGGYRGVHGISSHTSGSYTTYGVYGEASGGATNYGVYASGDLGASGSKTAVVRTADGPKAVYCQESTEVWFEDFGTGVIQNGLATVRLAADFLQTVTINEEHPVKVFVTPKADIGRWWVQDSAEAFELHAPAAPDGAMFDYRVVAKRTGYEDLRLVAVPSAYADHFLYPAISDVPASHQAEWLKAEALKQDSVNDPAADR